VLADDEDFPGNLQKQISKKKNWINYFEGIYLVNEKLIKKQNDIEESLSVLMSLGDDRGK
jgi:hypothetical protein